MVSSDCWIRFVACVIWRVGWRVLDWSRWTVVDIFSVRKPFWSFGSMSMVASSSTSICSCWLLIWKPSQAQASYNGPVWLRYMVYSDQPQDLRPSFRTSFLMSPLESYYKTANTIKKKNDDSAYDPDFLPLLCKASLAHYTTPYIVADGWKNNLSVIWPFGVTACCGN